MDQKPPKPPRPPRMNVTQQQSGSSSSSKQIKINIKLPELNMDDLKKHSHMLVSPMSQAATTRRSSSERWNCLCSPTSHAGSFRCQRHRAAAAAAAANGMHRRARSVGSNLEALATKAGTVSDS